MGVKINKYIFTEVYKVKLECVLEINICKKI